MANIVSLISNALTSQKTDRTQKQNGVRAVSNNPFSANPFVSTNSRTDSSLYAQNKPIQGGYFAGYHNGKANVVGQRLFIEA